MTIVSFFHTIFWWLIISFLYFFFTSLILPFSFFSKKPELLFFRAAKIWAKIALFLTFVKIKFESFDKIPEKGPLIITSNHQSFLDIFLLLAYFPRQFRFVVKKELFHVPFLGWYMKKAGFLSIDRQKAIDAHKTLQTIKDLLEEGEAILFFPEGTRSPDGRLKEFKRGGFDLALTTGSPILPVGISGSFRFVPKGKILFKPTSVSLKFGKIISAPKNLEPLKKNHEEIIEKVRNEILNLIES